MIVTPLMLPLAGALGVTSIQLGAIICVSMGVGMLTPPVAQILFVAARVSGLRIDEFFKPVVPFILLGLIPVHLMVTFIPALSTWLPKVVLG